MTAIIRRELNAYFTSPIGYIYLSVFYLFSGFYFFTETLISGTADLKDVFQSMFTITLFLIPILTMRLMSEDKKLKTDQLLLTAPISLTGLVFGKFFAAVLVYLLGISINLVFGVVLSAFAVLDWAVVIGHFIGAIVLGLALIAIGMFISSLTENQVIAAVGGFAISMFLMLIDNLASAVNTPWLSAFLKNISFYNRYNSFTIGILSFANVIFFLSAAAVFIFLTIRALDKKRWS